MASISGHWILHGLEPHSPRYRGSNDSNRQWLASAHACAETTRLKGQENGIPENWDEGAFARQIERHLKRFGPSPQALGFRLSDIDEFLDDDFSRKTLFPLRDNPQGAPMGVRMDAYERLADAAVFSLYDSALHPEALTEPPDEMIHVTCTGYPAPSPIQKLILAKGWNDRTQATHAYHMGCYASLPAIRMGCGLLGQGSKARRCDLIHTEICTLHLNPARHDPEQLVVQSLFGDGYIRYSLSPETAWKEASAYSKGAFAILGFHEYLVPNSIEDIGWVPAENGMRMTLSRNVPDRIASVIQPFLHQLAQHCSLPLEDLQKATYAVHPGGPRIVDKVQEWLRLTDAQVAASRHILYERGNMSSSTLPHIWHALNSPAFLKGDDLVVSLAFGPGLTLYGLVMRRLKTDA
jgi:predicted naringenin-chalcone synthase